MKNNKVTKVKMISLPLKNVNEAIRMLKENAQEQEEFDLCINDPKEINDLTAYNHSVIIQLLYGKLDFSFE